MWSAKRGRCLAPGTVAFGDGLAWHNVILRSRCDEESAAARPMAWDRPCHHNNGDSAMGSRSATTTLLTSARFRPFGGACPEHVEGLRVALRQNTRRNVILRSRRDEESTAARLLDWVRRCHRNSSAGRRVRPNGFGISCGAKRRQLHAVVRPSCIIFAETIRRQQPKHRRAERLTHCRVAGRRLRRPPLQRVA